MRKESALYIATVLFALVLECNHHPHWADVLWVSLIVWTLVGDFGMKVNKGDSIGGD